MLTKILSQTSQVIPSFSGCPKASRHYLLAKWCNEAKMPEVHQAPHNRESSDAIPDHPSNAESSNFDYTYCEDYLRSALPNSLYHVGESSDAEGTFWAWDTWWVIHVNIPRARCLSFSICFRRSSKYQESSQQSLPFSMVF